MCLHEVTTHPSPNDNDLLCYNYESDLPVSRRYFPIIFMSVHIIATLWAIKAAKGLLQKSRITFRHEVMNEKADEYCKST